MRFLVQRSSQNWKNVVDDSPPCRGAEGRGAGVWTIELNTLGDLLAVGVRTGSALLVDARSHTPTIEIQDGPSAEPRAADALVIVEPTHSSTCEGCGHLPRLRTLQPPVRHATGRPSRPLRPARRDRARAGGMTTEAYVWWCGDECDCCQPRIDRLGPEYGRTTRMPLRTNLWEGTFISEPTAAESAALRQELAEECMRRGIEVTDYAR